MKQGLLARRNLFAQVKFGKIMGFSSPKDKSQSLSQHFRSALEQLPQQQRQVLEMAYDLGLSQSEIAQQLEIPLGTLKSRTRQGLLKQEANITVIG